MAFPLRSISGGVGVLTRNYGLSVDQLHGCTLVTGDGQRWKLSEANARRINDPRYSMSQRSSGSSATSQHNYATLVSQFCTISQ